MYVHTVVQLGGKELVKIVRHELYTTKTLAACM